MSRSLHLMLAGSVLSVAACNVLSGASNLVAVDETSPSTSDNGNRSGNGNGGPDGGSLPRCGAGRVCLPAFAGWSPIVLMDRRDGACQTDYPTATTLRGVPTNGAGSSCDCQCSPVGGSCTQVTVYGGPMCGTALASLTLPADGSCATTPSFNLTSSASLRIAQDAGAPKSCTASVAADLRAPMETTICEGAAPATSEGCSGSERCVGEARGDGLNCLVRDGDVACPDPALSERLLLGGNPTDGRACSPCTCATDSCAGTQVTLSARSDCLIGLAKLNANGPCSQIFAGTSAMIAARLTPGSGCVTATPSKLTGDITFESPRTVCCVDGRGGPGGN